MNGANSFIKVKPATEDHVSSQSHSSACDAVKYAMFSKSQACQMLSYVMLDNDNDNEDLYSAGIRQLNNANCA